MSFLPSWYGLLCSLIVLNVLFETGVSGSSSISNPLEADDILKNHTFGNHHQCQRLCWYIELCERFSFYTKNLDNAHPHNCVLHAGEEKDDDLSDGWMQEKASGDYLPSEHGCRNRTCGKKKVCIPLAMPDVKYDCIDLPADIDECASNPCQHGGSCADQVNGYNCTCQPGYTGLLCETGTWLNMSCKTNASCGYKLAGCYSETCLCKGGLFFSRSKYECVEKCENIVHDTYLHYKHWDMKDEGAGGINNVNLTACASICTDLLYCRAFTVNKANCWPKNITAPAKAPTWVNDSKVSTYHKTCQ